MDAIPKFLTSALVIIFAVFIGVSLIICGTSMVSARSFYSDVSGAIASADNSYEERMIEECITLAEQNGYILTAEKKPIGEDEYYYSVVLEYKLIAPFFGSALSGTVSGYVYPGTHVS